MTSMNLPACDQKSDEEIIALTLADQGYYACLIERYEQKLTNYIRRLAGLGAEDTEDLLQDIFIKIYQNLNDFDQNLKFSSWAYRIAHNEIISHWRKSSSRPRLIGGNEVEEFLHNVADETNIHVDLEKQSVREDIQKVLEKIDLKYREVLVLKFLEEKSYEEIADILKKPLGTISTLISRAKKLFKKEADKLNIKF
ncbi:MAG: RNA polymerase sigma factor [Patescibacteria group bacterium]